MIGGGIYQITNVFNGKKYVGSTVDFERRWKRHLDNLRKGRHHNSRLQRAYNKYGEGVFEFSVLEYVGTNRNLLEREQFYINLLHPEYNVLRAYPRPRFYQRSSRRRREYRVRLSNGKRVGKHEKRRAKDRVTRHRQTHRSRERWGEKTVRKGNKPKRNGSKGKRKSSEL